MSAILVFVLIVATIVLLYYRRKGYWRRRGIPGPESDLFFGNLRQLGRSMVRPHAFQIRDWTQKYGKYYGMQRGWLNTLVVSDAKMAMDVMSGQFENFHARDSAPITGNPDKQPFTHVFLARGQKWRRLRSLTSPAFTVQSLKKILPSVEYSATESIRHLEKKLATGEEFNIHRYFHEFTMDVVCRAAFGQTESKQFENEFTDIIIFILNNAEQPLNTLSFILPFAGTALNKVARGLAFANLRTNKFVYLLKTLQQTIKERKEQKKSDALTAERESEDFIDMFLEVQSDDVKVEYNGVYDKSNHQYEKKLTTNEVVGQCILFLFAGFDTTANTLAYSAYYLAKYPEIQDKARAEIEELCRSAVPTYAELQNLRYLEAMMKEVLRFHPIAAIASARRAARDTMLGDVMIEEGTDIRLDVLTLHFDKEQWGEDADEFRPERWMDTERKTPPTFFGFGAGPRVCAGMRLAVLEQRIYLVHLLRRFRILPTKKLDEMKTIGFILHPDQVTVRLEEVNA